MAEIIGEREVKQGRGRFHKEYLIGRRSLNRHGAGQDLEGSQGVKTKEVPIVVNRYVVLHWSKLVGSQEAITSRERDLPF